MFNQDILEEVKSIKLLKNLCIKMKKIDEKEHQSGKGDIIIKTRFGAKNCELKNTLKLDSKSVCVEIANTSNLDDVSGWFQKCCTDYICYTDSNAGVAIFYDWVKFKAKVTEWLNSKECRLLSNFEEKENFAPYRTGAIICFVPIEFLESIKPCIKRIDDII